MAHADRLHSVLWGGRAIAEEWRYKFHLRTSSVGSEQYFAGNLPHIWSQGGRPEISGVEENHELEQSAGCQHIIRVLLCCFLVHFHAKARLVRGSDMAIDDDLAFLHERLPGIEVINPMPLACQKVRIGGACVSSSHDPNRRDHAVRRYRNVV